MYSLHKIILTPACMHVGWRRYETEEELRVMDELMRVISMRFNYFIPTMKLVDYERVGKRKKCKKYEIKTPYRRLVESGELGEEEGSRLRKRKESIRFYELTKRIIRLKNELERAYNRKRREAGDESNKKGGISND